MPYIPCPKCGQKALNIATRCPHCGHPFDSRLWQYPASVSRRRRIPVGLFIVGGLVTVVVVSAVQRKLQFTIGTSSAARPSMVAVDSAPPPPPPVAAVEPAESVSPVESVSPIDSGTSTADSATAPTPSLAPAPPVSGHTERRYASTWVNVRAARSGSAPVVRVLNPGDSVMVDSLSRGWYRVAGNGQTLGYVDRSLVGTAPESVPP